MSERDQLREPVLRHPLFERAVSGLVRLQRHIRGEAHQLQLVRILDDAASRGDGRGADNIECRRGATGSEAEDEADRFLDPQRAAPHPPLPQPGRDQRVGVLVLLPGQDFRRAGQRPLRDLLHRPPLLECRGDHECGSVHRQCQREKPLAEPPADPGEVLERGAAGQQDRVDPVFRHQPPRLFDAVAPLGGRDRPRLIPHRIERRDRGGADHSERVRARQGWGTRRCSCDSSLGRRHPPGRASRCRESGGVRS